MLPHATPDAEKHGQEGDGALSFDLLGEQANQCDVDLPGPSNFFLTGIEKIHKCLSSSFSVGTL